MSMLDVVKAIYNHERCNTCNHVDVCKNNTDVKHRNLPPLTQRGEERICFECSHSYWRIDRDKGTRTCLTEGCGVVRDLTDESTQIKHQR